MLHFSWGTVQFMICEQWSEQPLLFHESNNYNDTLLFSWKQDVLPRKTLVKFQRNYFFKKIPNWAYSNQYMKTPSYYYSAGNNFSYLKRPFKPSFRKDLFQNWSDINHNTVFTRISATALIIQSSCMGMLQFISWSSKASLSTNLIPII